MHHPAMQEHRTNCGRPRRQDNQLWRQDSRTADMRWHKAVGKEGVSFDLSPRGSIDTGTSDKENEPSQAFSTQSTSMTRRVLGELTSPNVLSYLAPTYDDVRSVLKPLSGNRSPASTLASSNTATVAPPLNISPHSFESSRSSPHSSMMKTAKISTMAWTKYPTL